MVRFPNQCRIPNAYSGIGVNLATTTRCRRGMPKGIHTVDLALCKRAGHICEMKGDYLNHQTSCQFVS